MTASQRGRLPARDALKAGPSIPSPSDVQLHHESQAEEAAQRREQELGSVRAARQAERKRQREVLDELAPRAEPGTRERQLEKRREKAESNRSFAASREAGGGEVELRDDELMGGNDEADSLAGLKRRQREQERKKNEREIRREEMIRARRAEREGRMREMKRKEDETVSMLKEIARARFGTPPDTGAGGGEAERK